MPDTNEELRDEFLEKAGQFDEVDREAREFCLVGDRMAQNAAAHCRGMAMAIQYCLERAS
jgi:hypothetical protein